MRPVVFVLVALLCGAPASTLSAKDLRSTRLQERFEFEMRDLKVSHQGGNTLTLYVRYTYRTGLKPADYPDFRKLAETTEEFFRSYPNDGDFWEIVNLKLTAKLFHDFPTLVSLTVEIHVMPSDRIPFARTSTVTRAR